jgi:hypothetical protein
MTANELPLAFHAAAFWVAVLAFRARVEPLRYAVRFPLGLALGALAAHLGWALLHLDAVRTMPALLLASTGFCVLFMPLGLLAVAPWRRGEHDAFLAAAFGALPVALATARLGCFAAGCCGPPVAIALDALGMVALHAAARSAPRPLVMPLVLGGIGAVRLALDPLREAPPLGPPLVSASWLAAGWLAVALVVAVRRSGGGGGLATEAPKASSPRRSA